MGTRTGELRWPMAMAVLLSGLLRMTLPAQLRLNGADRAHEPQEEDAAERHQPKRELDLAAVARLGQPRAGGGMRVGGHDPEEEDDDEPEQEAIPARPAARGVRSARGVVSSVATLVMSRTRSHSAGGCGA